MEIPKSKRSVTPTESRVGPEGQRTITCHVCKEIKNVEDFYVSNWSTCKRCCCLRNRLRNYNFKITPEMERFCILDGKNWNEYCKKKKEKDHNKEIGTNGRIKLIEDNIINIKERIHELLCKSNMETQTENSEEATEEGTEETDEINEKSSHEVQAMRNSYGVTHRPRRAESKFFQRIITGQTETKPSSAKGKTNEKEKMPGVPPFELTRQDALLKLHHEETLNRLANLEEETFLMAKCLVELKENKPIRNDRNGRNGRY